MVIKFFLNETETCWIYLGGKYEKECKSHDGTITNLEMQVN